MSNFLKNIENRTTATILGFIGAVSLSACGINAGAVESIHCTGQQDTVVKPGDTLTGSLAEGPADGLTPDQVHLAVLEVSRQWREQGNANTINEFTVTAADLPINGYTYSLKSGETITIPEECFVEDTKN